MAIRLFHLEAAGRIPVGAGRIPIGVGRALSHHARTRSQVLDGRIARVLTREIVERIDRLFRARFQSRRGQKIARIAQISVPASPATHAPELEIASQSSDSLAAEVLPSAGAIRPANSQ